MNNTSIFNRKYLGLLVLALALTGCATMLDPVVNQQQSCHPPSLNDWCQDVPVHFLLVNGMNNYPFGMDPPNSSKPNYLGCTDYRDLYTKLGKSDQQAGSKLMGLAKTAAINSQYTDFINLLTSDIGYTDTDPITKKLIEPKFSILRTPDGDPLGFYYERKFVDAEGKRQPIYFHGVDWAILAVKDKEDCYGNWDGSDIPPGTYGEFEKSLGDMRDYLDKNLKFDVVDWGLGDAALYLNQRSGRELRWCIAEGMLKMIVSTKSGDRFMIRTHSLGSTMVFDTMRMMMSDESPRPGVPSLMTLPGTTWMDEYATWEKDKPFTSLLAPYDQSDIARTAFYMLANQYALLSLGRYQDNNVAHQNSQTHEDSMTDLAQEIKQSPSPTGNIQVVAFTDPDDLLSFPVATQPGPFKIANVYLSNNHWKLPILGVWPPYAHTRYDNNEQVMRIIRDGIPPDTYAILQ